MSDFLAPNGKPYCFDEDDYFDASDGLVEACVGCPARYQEQMLRERRCFPPDPSETAVGHLMQTVKDPVNLRVILAQIRVGFVSDRLSQAPSYLGRP